MGFLALILASAVSSAAAPALADRADFRALERDLNQAAQARACHLRSDGWLDRIATASMTKTQDIAHRLGRQDLALRASLYDEGVRRLADAIVPALQRPASDDCQALARDHGLLDRLDAVADQEKQSPTRFVGVADAEGPAQVLAQRPEFQLIATQVGLGVVATRCELRARPWLDSVIFGAVARTEALGVELYPSQPGRAASEVDEALKLFPSVMTRAAATAALGDCDAFARSDELKHVDALAAEASVKTPAPATP
jgi:hypothetical protein